MYDSLDALEKLCLGVSRGFVWLTMLIIEAAYAHVIISAHTLLQIYICNSHDCSSKQLFKQEIDILASIMTRTAVVVSLACLILACATTANNVSSGLEALPVVSCESFALDITLCGNHNDDYTSSSNDTTGIAITKRAYSTPPPQSSYNTLAPPSTPPGSASTRSASSQLQAPTSTIAAETQQSSSANQWLVRSTLGNITSGLDNTTLYSIPIEVNEYKALLEAITNALEPYDAHKTTTYFTYETSRWAFDMIAIEGSIPYLILRRALHRLGVLAAEISLLRNETKTRVGTIQVGANATADFAFYPIQTDLQPKNISAYNQTLTLNASDTVLVETFADNGISTTTENGTELNQMIASLNQFEASLDYNATSSNASATTGELGTVSHDGGRKLVRRASYTDHQGRPYSFGNALPLRIAVQAAYSFVITSHYVIWEQLNSREFFARRTLTRTFIETLQSALTSVAVAQLRAADQIANQGGDRDLAAYQSIASGRVYYAWGRVNFVMWIDDPQTINFAAWQLFLQALLTRYTSLLNDFGVYFVPDSFGEITINGPGLKREQIGGWAMQVIDA